MIFSDTVISILGSEFGIKGVTDIANARINIQHPMLNHPIEPYMVEEMICALVELANKMDEEKKK